MYKFVFIVLSVFIAKIDGIYGYEREVILTLNHRSSILTITKLSFKIYYEFYCKVSFDNVLRFSRKLQKLY